MCSQDGGQKPVKITSSLFLAAQGRIACGRQDGSIIIISAIKAAKTQFMMENNTDPAGECERVQVLRANLTEGAGIFPRAALGLY